MRFRIARIFSVAAAGLWLAACNTTGTNDIFASADPSAPPPEPAASALVADPGAPPAAALLGGDPTDDLSRGKVQYRARNYGLAEKHFRAAAESHPRDAEAWIGLAASYDQLKRFDLADRAYAQAIRIVGPTVEILNNQGYSYMLRGDYPRAHATLLTAQRKAPDNQFVANNMRLLAESQRTGKAIR